MTRRLLRRLAATFVVVACVLAGLVVYISQRLLVPPWAHRDLACSALEHDVWQWCGTPEQELALPFEDVSFATRDGLTLRGWWVPAAAPEAGVVVFVHGGGGDRREGMRHVSFLNPRHWSVLLFDLRGHALSDDDGRGLGYGVRESEDVRAAVAFVRGRTAAPIAVVAGSMGAASTLLALANLGDVRAFVLENTYPTFPDLTAAALTGVYGAPSFLARWATWMTVQRRPELASARPIDHIGAVSPRPLLLVYGDVDRFTPVAQGQALLAAAGEPKALWVVPGADHGALWNHARAAYEERVSAFLTAALAGGTRLD